MPKERIKILCDADVITEQVYTFVCSVIDELQKDFGDKTQVIEMLTTHLAMATQRVLQAEEVESLDDTLWKEVCSSPYFEKATTLYDALRKDAPCEYPEGEQRFLMMHLCNLFQ